MTCNRTMDGEKKVGKKPNQKKKYTLNWKKVKREIYPFSINTCGKNNT